MDYSNWRTIIGIGSGAILCGANVIYFVAVIKGTTRPNRATWFLLATVSLVIAASYRDLGAGPTLYAAIGAAAITPTIKHAIEAPEEEDLLAWNLTLPGDVLAVIAINAWTINIALYPLYMVAINGLVVLCLYRPLVRNAL